MSTNATRRLHATSIAPAAKAWLAKTKQATVLYSFEKVIDFVNQEADVLSLVSYTLGNGPFSVVLAESEFPTGVESDATMLIFENGMWLNDSLIDIEEAELWEPRPDWESVRAQTKDLMWASEKIRSLLKEHAQPDSLARLILDPVSDSPLPARILQAAEQNIPLLYSGIAEGKTDLVTKAAKGLAGLGPGLTPAGDDLLLGAMHGLWATLDDDQARPLARTIANAAVPRTHALSAAWLLAGDRGEAAEAWHEFISAIAAREESNLETAVMRILPTGHTSGADALGGFLGILQGLGK